MSNVEKLFQGDQRCEAVVEHILELLYKEAIGMPIPTIIGMLELVKLQIIKDSED